VFNFTINLQCLFASVQTAFDGRARRKKHRHDRWSNEHDKAMKRFFSLFLWLSLTAAAVAAAAARLLLLGVAFLPFHLSNSFHPTQQTNTPHSLGFHSLFHVLLLFLLHLLVGDVSYKILLLPLNVSLRQ
jgi:hypothetical protein